MDDDRTHYEVIDVDPTAAKAEVKSAYQAALNHTNATGDAEETARVRRAWQVLSDPVQRQRYDEEIGITGRGPGPAGSGVEVVDDEETDDDGLGLDDDGSAAVVARPPGAPYIPDFLEQPTLGRRVTASLIDVITTLAVYAALGAIAFAALGGDTARFVALIVLFEALVIGFFVVPTARTGQTLGKRFTYIMTVDRETGHLPTVGQTIRRYLVPMVAVPALLQMGAFLALFFGLSYAMGRDQLSLADRLAKTLVVVARYEPVRADQAG